MPRIFYEPPTEDPEQPKRFCDGLREDLKYCLINSDCVQKVCRILKATYLLFDLFHKCIGVDAIEAHPLLSWLTLLSVCVELILDYIISPPGPIPNYIISPEKTIANTNPNPEP